MTSTRVGSTRTRSTDADSSPFDEPVHERGLSGRWCVALVLALGIAGGTWDVLTGRGLREVFAICFVVGCGLAAALARRRSLLTAVAAPPLLYVLLALGGGILGDARVPVTISRQGAELVSALVIGAPVLIGATALAVGVAVLRLLGARRR